MSKDDSIDNGIKGGDDTLDDISWDDIGDEGTAIDESAAAPAPAKKASDAGKRPAEFSELKEGGVKAASGDLGFIMDIPLEVTVEL